MQKREFILPLEHCPMCGANGTFQMKCRIDDIPFFGETMETLVTCSRCDFKHSDVIHLEEREPSRYEFQVSSEEDMNVRVVRSSTGIIELPEIGVEVKPGPKAEGYITNIEGILNRIKEAIESAKNDAGPDKSRVADEKLDFLEKMKRGEKKARLILVDPLGHSAIVDERARKRRLTEEEISAL
jgi:zinc finger protein